MWTTDVENCSPNAAYAGWITGVDGLGADGYLWHFDARA
jgi:hypothetical protein